MALNCPLRTCYPLSGHAYSSALSDSIERGNAALATTQASITDAEGIDKAIDILTDALLSKPDLFTAHATSIGLILNEKPAIAEFRNVLKKRYKEIIDAVNLVKLRKNNLDSNIQQLRTSECNLAGNWAGSMNIDGTPFPMSLSISGVPGNYTLSFSLNGRTNMNPCVIKIDAANRSLLFRPTCVPPLNTSIFSLGFNESYTAISGASTDPTDDSNFPITLQKQ